MATNHGIGILEILVTITLFSLLLLALHTSYSKQFRVSRYLQSNVQFTTLTTNLEMILGNFKSCSKSLHNAKGKSPIFDPDNPSVPIQKRLSYINVGGATFAGIGQTIDTLRITSLSLVELDPTLRVIGPDYIRYLANLTIQATRTGEHLMQDNLNYQMLLWLTVDSVTHEINDCYRGIWSSPSPSPSPSPNP